jgi:hypothetical protein
MAKRGATRYPGRGSLLISGVVLLLALAGVWYFGIRPRGSATGSDSSAQVIEFPHMHGLGFSSDGRQLLVPAHIGLRIYEDGRWLAPDLPAHDYMGYTPVDDGFYSSGHPDLRTNHVNPLGVVKSTDGGQTLTTLGFEGETDFHLMAAGYTNHALYVFNPSPNSTLSAGLHYSLDDGQTWEQSQAQGLSGEPIQIAVHPTDANIVAVAAQGGLLLSEDYGQTFRRVSDIAPVTATAFDPNGQQLYFGFQQLHLLNLENEAVSQLQIPSITGENAIAYIAANPVTDELAIATFNRDIYLSRDNGQTWQPIAQAGVGNRQ